MISIDGTAHGHLRNYPTTSRAEPKPAGQLLTGEVHRMHGVFCMVDMMRELKRLLQILRAPISPRVPDGRQREQHD